MPVFTGLRPGSGHFRPLFASSWRSSFTHRAMSKAGSGSRAGHVPLSRSSSVPGAGCRVQRPAAGSQGDQGPAGVRRGVPQGKCRGAAGQQAGGPAPATQAGGGGGGRGGGGFYISSPARLFFI